MNKEDFITSPAILWNSAFRWVYLSLSPLPFASLLYLAICKASDNHFPLLHFFFWGGWGMVLVTHPVQCYEPLYMVVLAFFLWDLIL